MMVVVWGRCGCGCGCGRDWLLILVDDGGRRCGGGLGSMNGVLGTGSSRRLPHRRCMGCSLVLGVEAETSFVVLVEALASWDGELVLMSQGTYQGMRWCSSDEIFMRGKWVCVIIGCEY